MQKADIITLITEHVGSHGVYDAPASTRTDVFCTVRSVGRTEHYAAMSHGFTPAKTVKLTVAEDYQDQRLCQIGGKTYEIIRTYETDDGGIELTLQRSDEHAND